MKQIQFSAFGQPSAVARCVEVPDLPEPAAWEVIVRVEACPINVADLAILSGRYGSLPKPPSTVGMEAVGIVEACGDSVSKVATGDRVIILANNNWAERRKVAEAAIHKVPADADPIQLSLLKVNPASAHVMLSDYETLQAGDWIVQTAPLGTVGQCVIQMCKQRGVHTLNVVRREEAIGEVKQSGGDAAILAGDGLAQQARSVVGNAPVRLALDAVAGPGTDGLCDCLSDDCTLVSYGMLSAEACVVRPEHTVFRNIAIRGFWLSKLLNRMTVDARTSLYDSLCQQVMDGSLNMTIDQCFPLASIGEALQRAEEGGREGKVVLTCG